MHLLIILRVQLKLFVTTLKVNSYPNLVPKKKDEESHALVKLTLIATNTINKPKEKVANIW